MTGTFCNSILNFTVELKGITKGLILKDDKTVEYGEMENVADLFLTLLPHCVENNLIDLESLLSFKKWLIDSNDYKYGYTHGVDILTFIRTELSKRNWEIYLDSSVDKYMFKQLVGR